jgi:hypothetical protein
MAVTTFSGPVKAGTIKFTTGSTLGYNVSNLGTMQLCQTEAITQATNGSSAGVYTTKIVIPANSTILSIALYVNAVWSGAATTLGIGNTVSATAYTAAGGVAGGTLGAVNAAPTTATQTNNWINVGTSDVELVVTSTNTGTGTGTLVVEYIQTGTLVP